MKINVIKPTIKQTDRKLNVCAYARVSTNDIRQEDSLENQTSTYKRLITANPSYNFVGVYADKGISGYSENRPAFQEMLVKARAGDIDLIITKSISRFARNTVTVLKVERELRDLGVGILFEEQSINTLSGEGEMMLSILASFTQEESRSISENSKWSLKKRFEQGKIFINTTRFMGYDKDKDGNLIINKEQAIIVDRIFRMYIEGVSAYKISIALNAENIPTLTNKEWRENTIRGMLRNEKYKGDFILQKYYTPENVRGKSVRNTGEVKSYYIVENHPAIISYEDWQMVQEIMKRRKEKRNIGQDGTSKYQNRYPLSGMLICPHCGKALRRRQVHNKKIEWWCSTYMEKGKATCKGVKISDSIVTKKNIKVKTVIEEEIRDGKKHYSYTSKKDYDNGVRNRVETTENGSILPSVNKPRRTAIKL